MHSCLKVPPQHFNRDLGVPLQLVDLFLFSGVCGHLPKLSPEHVNWVVV